METAAGGRAAITAPAAAIAAARSALGAIDLDPWSTPILNRAVGAARLLNREQLPLEEVLRQPWGENQGLGRAFLSLSGDATSCRQLLNKARREHQSGRLASAVIWLAHLETLCRCPWVWDQLVLIPFRRLRPQYYDEELEQFCPISPSNWSVLIAIPPAEARAQWGFINRFSAATADLGRLIDAEADTSWEYGWKQCTGKPWSDRS